jgi:hypothetical protein
VAGLLAAGDFAGLAALAGRQRGIPEALLKFLYDPRDLLHWRAVEGLGRLAGVYPRQVQKVIGRLLWLLNEDSGSFGWGAAAALGEIGRGQVSLVAEIIPMFCGFLEEKFSRAAALWGLGRLAQAHPELLGEVLPLAPPLLLDADPEVRACAAWCLGQARYREAAVGLEALLADGQEVLLYDGGELRRTTVGRVAGEALAALQKPPRPH